MDDPIRRGISTAYSSFHGELVKFFGKRLDNTSDAADLAQDAFTQWLDRGRDSDVRQPRAFLFQIARNLLRDHWRRQRSRPLSVESESESMIELKAPGGPQEVVEQQQRLHLLAQALDDLPPRRREAFVLHRFDGLSQAEVAQQMGISLSMVEKHVASALLHCKRRLDAEMVAGGEER
ncbi:RNA polymerase sigma factor [Pseudomonas sp. ML96]|uniref:RNA polymerase sigma factor n=1 Tax=Pseudomonas sp. ML96 TaxID=1523503 RepID=UPI0005B8FE2C|nr:sigma-70 family RNA polymerase sigma factor [Pseudomonas sp. ML96]